MFFKLYLKLKGEPLAWMCEKYSLDRFFKTFGFYVSDIYGADGFKQRYLPENFNDALQTIEYIAIAAPG